MKKNVAMQNILNKLALQQQTLVSFFFNSCCLEVSAVTIVTAVRGLTADVQETGNVNVNMLS